MDTFYSIFSPSDFAFRLHIQSILDNNRAMICATVQIEFSLETIMETIIKIKSLQDHMSTRLNSFAHVKRLENHKKSNKKNHWKYNV